MGSAIEVHKLVKHYKNVEALRGVDLTIPEGEFFGLLGPNGAGKTTMISCIVGLVKPTGGRVLVHSVDVTRDPLQTKAMIGFAPQEVNIEYFFPIQKTLEFQGGYFGLSPRESRRRAEELLKRFNLWDKRDEQYFRLSGGMKRRLMIIRAMMGSPRILILDEPTAGVDVELRHDLWELLRQLKAGGTTILLTTHYIDEAEALCERVGVIHKGEMVELGSPEALISKYCARRVMIDMSQPITAPELEGLDAQFEIGAKGYSLVARPRQSANGRIGPMVEGLLQRISQKPERRVSDLRIDGGDLEEVFLKLTGSRIYES